MFQKNFDDYAHLFVEDVEHTIKQKYPAFKISITKFDWSPRRTRSKGGRYSKGYGISIAMKRYLNWGKDTHRVYEYASYDSDPVIGGFYTSNPLDSLKMVICHEMAHALQFYMFDCGYRVEEPHGVLFKTLYKDLRI